MNNSRAAHFRRRAFSLSAGALVAVLWAATMDTRRLRETMERAEARNPIIWASLFSRNVLPGVVNIHRSTHELLDRILDGQTPPDLDEGATPVIVSAFDPTRLKTRVFSDGKAAEALAASMAVPVLFKPVWSNGRPLIDGAVGDVAGVDGLERSDRVLYHHATYLPLWLTQHLAGFSDLVALKIHGLPYLNPWQLQGNGMDAFRLAKEATLRALDCPMTATRWSAGEVARKADTENSGSGSNSSGGGSRAGIGGFSPSSEVGNQGVRLVEVRTRRHRGTGDDDGGVRSRL
ncbi:unnamed protein product [Scytosiphon promiscuus]